ncbi:MAG: hypothetical protein IH849_08170 [Acidobacteria bacterium]|nr:hypothetical protein [Acidobacteriota bacterium]
MRMTAIAILAAALVASTLAVGDEAAASAASTLAVGHEAVAGQLLRGADRATITEAAADHEPFALDQTVRLAVEVEMLPGMHVNANPPTFDWMIPVEVSVEGAEGVSLFEVFYPQPISVKFPYDDEPYLVYKDTFVLGLVLVIAADIPAGGRELEVVLDYQACDDEACYAPTDTSIKIPIMIVADAAQSRAVSSPLLDRAPFPRN